MGHLFYLKYSAYKFFIDSELRYAFLPWYTSAYLHFFLDFLDPRNTSEQIIGGNFQTIVDMQI